MLAAAPKLAAIGCFCIGTNQVDLAAARPSAASRSSTRPTPTRAASPSSCSARSSCCCAGIPQEVALVHRGGWTKTAKGSFEVRGKTLGIVGYGHIGTQVGILAEALGMRVLFYDVVKLALGNARACRVPR
jgi:D-3-phosphoglycerate dehydrogenase